MTARMQTPMDELKRAHRSLCSGFVSEDLFRRVLGGGRADISLVAAYLQIPVPQRPPLSWYLDPAYYLAANPDIAEAGLDPLLHFVDTGIAELRSPHPLIDLHYITAEDAFVLGATPQIDALVDLLEYDLASPSPYFDPAHYMEQLAGAAPGNALLRHFLQHGLRAGHKPNAFLDPAWYAERYPDVPGDPYTALRHFIIRGDFEGRAAGAGFDGTLYRARYTDVGDSAIPPLRHYLMHGRREGRQAAAERKAVAPATPAASIDVGLPLAADAQEAEHAFADMRQRVEAARQHRKDAVRVKPPALATCVAPAKDLAKLKLPRVRAPRLSILVPVFNEVRITVECLLAIQRAKPGLPFEVVVADDCSTDPDMALFGQVANLVYLRQPANLGFLGNCNAAFARCRGEYVLLLNNDAQVLAGAIDRLVAALDADPAVAAVGPKIVYPTGRLQEAGCFVRPNGESGMVGLFADPAEGGYCYDRDVTYCSGAALMVRRALVGQTLFDEAYRPAYCEDADLCLRLIAAGHRVRYIGGATVAHHLSVSTNRGSLDRKLRGIGRNQQILSERWGELLARMDAVRVLAFYLPQFHPTPENDLWWGAGFTEWTNVVKARPSYGGHHQPHLPADLGFYDLRTPEALHRQALLARRYGIEGFCVYYYNFGSRRVLSRPLETVRAHPDIPFRWCLCWANENWTKHWDGGEREILLEQSYDPATLDAIIGDAVAQAADPRYIRVNGKPLFLVYRPLLLPDAAAFATSCRAAFAAAGFSGVHLAYVESMEAVDRAMRPADLGFDACVEFPPHGRAVPASGSADIVKPGWSGYRYDYPDTVTAFLERDTVPYPRYPAVFPSWDNTPRQPLRGTSFDAVSPAAFRVYVEEKVEEIRRFLMGDERLLFVNAWNEWAEGAHLEPDSLYGHRWLEALRDGIAAKSWA
jgi:GT2 family glycosyltransferase